MNTHKPPPQEFGPDDMAQLLTAVADMHVGDADLAAGAAAAVAARRGEYGGEQLAAARAALAKMGFDGLGPD